MHSSAEHFSNLESGYPNPFAGNNSGYNNPRAQYDTPPQFRIPVNSRMIEDVNTTDYTKRNYVNETNNYPQRGPTPNPFSHLMKQRTTDSLSDILGTKQNVSKLEPKNFSNMPTESAGYYQSYLDNVYADIPRNDSQYNQHKQSLVGPPPVSQRYDNGSPYIPSMDQPKVKILDSDFFDLGTPGLVKYNSPGENGKKASVYTAINEYFKDFIMTKTAIYGEYSVYQSIVQCLLCIGTRYIVAIVKDDQAPISTRKPLYTLNWVSFQTRFTEKPEELTKYGIGSFTVIPPNETILEDVIRLNRRTTKSNIYYCDNLPLQVEVLRDEEDETKDDLSEVGRLTSALELYSTILSFLD